MEVGISGNSNKLSEHVQSNDELMSECKKILSLNWKNPVAIPGNTSTLAEKKI